MPSRKTPFLIVALLFAAPLRADYVMTATIGGATRIGIHPGESISIDLTLVSDAGDVHNSLITRVFFTEAGLTYDGYAWNAPYSNAPPGDDSTPDNAALPQVLDPNTLISPQAPGLVDLELSNVLFSGVFGSGRFVTLNFTVPPDLQFIGSIFVGAVPDTVADGFDEIATEPGALLQLVIVPSCPDIDRDGTVGLSDLSVQLGNFGTTSGASFFDGDVTGDGGVDIDDLSILLGEFGTACP